MNCEDIKSICAIAAIMGGCIGFVLSRVFDIAKTQRTEFNDSIEEAKSLIASTIDTACKYWSLNQDPQNSLFVDLQENIKTSATHINGSMINLGNSWKRFNVTQAERHAISFCTIITSGDFETHSRKADSSRCTHIRSFGVSFEGFLQDSKIPKTWWN